MTMAKGSAGSQGPDDNMRTYNHLSQEWLVDLRQAGPEAILRRLVETVGQNLSPHDLGHVKGYASWLGGEAFASTTLTPPEVNGRATGLYPGGPVEIGLTVILINVPLDTIQSAVDSALGQLEREFNCQFKNLSTERRDG
jgi:hypothetical protein